MCFPFFKKIKSEELKKGDNDGLKDILEVFTLRNDDFNEAKDVIKDGLTVLDFNKICGGEDELTSAIRKKQLEKK